jgi:DNA-binding MarR family transcriptional regulator
VEENVIKDLINRYVAVSFKVNKKAEFLVKEQISDDLTNEQHYLLRYIHEVGKCTSSELAEVFEVNKSAITAIINRMADRELIDRTRDADDRRVVYLTLTPLGNQLFEKTEEKVHCLVQSIITQFDTEEIQSFIKTYEKLADILMNIKKEQQED